MAGAKHLKNHFSACICRLISRAWLGSGAAGPESGTPIWDAVVASIDFTRCATALAPFFFKVENVLSLY